VGLTGVGAELRLEWQAVAAAVAYRVELTRKENGRDVVVAQIVPGAETHTRLAGLPPGWYHPAVSSVDAEGFESAPNRTQPVRVWEARVVPGRALHKRRSETAADVAGAEQAPPLVLNGAVLELPEGILCGAADGAQRFTQLALSATSAHTIRCSDIHGEPVMLSPLECVAPRLTPAGLTAGAEWVVPPGESSELPFVLESPFAVTEGISLQLPPAVQGALVGLAGAARPRLRLTPLQGAPQRFVARITLGERDEAVVVATVPVRIASAEPYVAPTPIALEPPTPPDGLELWHQALLADVLPVRDRRGPGRRAWVSLGVTPKGNHDEAGVARMALGGEWAWLQDRLRLTVGHGLDLYDDGGVVGGRGARGLLTALDWSFSRDAALGVTASAQLWWPTVGNAAGDRVARFGPSAEIASTLWQRLTLRTRQGALIDLQRDGALQWASSYAADVWVVGPLALGLEGLLGVGTAGGSRVLAAVASAGLKLQSPSFSGSLGAGLPLTADAEAWLAPFTLLLSLEWHP
jgi:hypothetical protein